MKKRMGRPTADNAVDLIQTSVTITREMADDLKQRYGNLSLGIRALYADSTVAVEPSQPTVHILVEVRTK